jgi:hypothetical protein
LNGQKDAGEPGFSVYPITVYMDYQGDGVLGSNTYSQAVDANGRYHFEDLPPGDYKVRIESAGFYQTKPVGPDYYSLQIERGENAQDIDFGLFSGS